MHRMKDEGRDILGPIFTKDGPAPVAQPVAKAEEIVMTNPNVTRKITLQELKAHDKPEEPWFVVNGEGELYRFLSHEGLADLSPFSL